uniref:hypothetical protein n=1 Tax=Ramaria cf. rubripermanens TaxID=2016387 RepID=UPI0022390A8D|nr:hypothetical protein OQ108_mgp36 [Ramaria cf. rubripermanens]UYR22186.1 hypothetical protein [Ramaria cf. rubripermanens]
MLKIRSVIPIDLLAVFSWNWSNDSLFNLKFSNLLSKIFYLARIRASSCSNLLNLLLRSSLKRDRLYPSSVAIVTPPVIIFPKLLNNNVFKFVILFFYTYF